MPRQKPAIKQRTKYPFAAKINGKKAIVWPNKIEYPGERPRRSSVQS